MTSLVFLLTLGLIAGGLALASNNETSNATGVPVPEDPYLDWPTHPHNKAFQIARQIPGYGGYFRDDNGNFNVFLVDYDSSEAIQAARPIIAAIFDIPAERVMFVKANYTIAQLGSWFYEDGFRLLLNEEGVLSVGLSSRHNSLRLALLDSADLDEITEKIEQLGIPPEAVNIRAGGGQGIELLGSLRATLVRPVAAGMRINGPDWTRCSIGAVVDQFFGEGFITASHSSETIFSNDGSAYYSHSVDDDTSIGEENIGPSLFGCAYAL